MAEPEEQMSTADLVDQYGDGLDSIDLQFRSFGLYRRFSGPVQTLKCFEDNALVKATLSDPTQPPGQVLVVDGGCSLRTALVGDIIAGAGLGWTRHLRCGARQRRPRPAAHRHQSAGHQSPQERQDWSRRDWRRHRNRRYFDIARADASFRRGRHRSPSLTAFADNAAWPTHRTRDVMCARLAEREPRCWDVG
jgi:hypothetical protein